MVNAALLATVLVGSVRNGRRRDAELAEQARLANAALREHAGDSQFVTGQIARIDLTAGTAQIVNAGHPPPLRLRDGVVDEVALDADPPFGARQVRVPRSTAALEPGDRLMFVTDGVLERDAANVDIRAMLAASRDQHPREAVQQLIQAAVHASGGELATTPPRCAWTGTAARPAIARRTQERTSPADRRERPASPPADAPAV